MPCRTVLPPESRRILATFTFSVSITLGCLALGLPAVAGAEPNSEWDIEAYDNCMSKTVRNAEYCCVLSGGSVTKDGVVRRPGRRGIGAQGGRKIRGRSGERRHDAEAADGSRASARMRA